MENNRYMEDDFNYFIKELIDNRRLNDSKEVGIAKLFIDKGLGGLTKNKNMFLRIL